MKKRIYFASYNNGEVTGEIFEKENNYEGTISEQHGTGSSSFSYDFETFEEALEFIHGNIYEELLK
jgi:hypothetical protein